MDPTIEQRPAGPEPQVAGFDEHALWEAVCRISGDTIIVVDPAGTLRFCNRFD